MNAAAIQAKTDKALNTQVRYPEGIMTRREWIKLMHSTGATVKEAFKSKIQYNRTKYNRMTGAEQEEYERKLQEKTVCYELHLSNGGFFDILKCEYDLFNSLS